jgi:hypothetical protein
MALLMVTSAAVIILNVVADVAHALVDVRVALAS